MGYYLRWWAIARYADGSREKRDGLAKGLTPREAANQFGEQWVSVEWPLGELTQNGPYLSVEYVLGMTERLAGESGLDLGAEINASTGGVDALLCMLDLSMPSRSGGHADLPKPRDILCALEARNTTEIACMGCKSIVGIVAKACPQCGSTGREFV
jgi:hypothetical protein